MEKESVSPLRAEWVLTTREANEKTVEKRQNHDDME